MDIPERGDAASLTEKLDCVTALWPRGGSWGKHGVRGTARHQVCSRSTAALRSSDRRYLHFSLGDGEAIQMLLMNLLPFGRNHHDSSAVARFP